MDKDKRHSGHRLLPLAATPALLAAAVSALWLCSTPHPTVLHRVYNMGGTWPSDSILCFTPDSIADDGRYVLTLTLRRQTAQRYPYRECYIEKTVATPTDTLRDTLCIRFDAPSGSDGSSDAVTESRGTAILQTDLNTDTLHLTPGWRGTISLRHLMRHHHLPGITTVGMTMTRLHNQS